jgi:hypothetical protein
MHVITAARGLGPYDCGNMILGTWSKGCVERTVVDVNAGFTVRLYRLKADEEKGYNSDGELH